MVKKKYVVITAVVLAAIVFVSISRIDTEEHKIKKQFDKFSELAAKKPSESAFIMVRKAKDIAELFDRQCILNTRFEELSGQYSSQEIQALAMRGRLMFSELSLKFHDIDISIAGENRADVTFTAKLSGSLKSKEHLSEAHEFRCVLNNVDDSWVFSEFELVEVLEK
ncbi:MAG: hypothetical protein JW920_01115 [Deltaproteobacteria bacterium]|nr:hypothetical protein [Deltaproteobacteria bacterium]